MKDHELYYDDEPGALDGWVLRVYREVERGTYTRTVHNDFAIGPDVEHGEPPPIDVDRACELAAYELDCAPADVEVSR